MLKIMWGQVICVLSYEMLSLPGYLKVWAIFVLVLWHFSDEMMLKSRE